MLNKKSLLCYLLIAFTIAWTLFLLPLLVGEPGSSLRQTVSLVCWSVAMWAPGLAAILTTLLVEKQPLATLNLRRLGEKKAYLWAWLLPLVLTLLAGLLTVLFGLGKLDLQFSAIRKAMEQAGSPGVSPALVIGIQVLIALTLGPLFNTLFGLGEELGWRGFLLPRLLPLGQFPAILISGAIWGIWHMPVILQGHNYPQHPVAGVFLMIGFCILFGAILSWLYLRTSSPWAPALGHGSLNAIAGLPLMFMPGVDLALGGTLTSLTGWIPLALFIGWLVWSKRLPAETPLSVPDTNLAPLEAAG